MITVVYAGDEPRGEWDASVFLAGPTPRSPDVASWRPAALAELPELWRGPGHLVVFVPEAPDGGRRARRRDRPGSGPGAAADARLTAGLAGDDVDWTTVGIVARVLLEPPVG